MSYKTPTFHEIFPDELTWSQKMSTAKPTPHISSTETLTAIYYLLDARYGSCSIASPTEESFVPKLNAVIWQYAPTWEKKLDIQEKLRNLSDDDFTVGSLAIYNHAENPADKPTPSTGDGEFLDYIDNQNTSRMKKGKLNAYGELWSLLTNDVTETFIRKFQKLFILVIEPEYDTIFY